MIRSVSDDDDDVRAVAAAALLPVAHTVSQIEKFVFVVTNIFYFAILIIS